MSRSICILHIIPLIGATTVTLFSAVFKNVSVISSVNVLALFIKGLKDLDGKWEQLTQKLKDKIGCNQVDAENI